MNPAELPLRDIHVPAPPAWWPPAPGWWILCGILVAGAAAFWWWWRRRRRAATAAQIALRELARLRAAAPQIGAATLARELSVLMRRAAISFYPRAEAAAITGEAWLQFLDRPLEGNPFSKGPGRLLAELPYRPGAAAAETGPLLDLCERWIAAASRRKEERA
jgi:hypothetical protein